MNKIEDMVAQAIGDPGSMVPRAGDDETVTRWATRAVLEVLEVAIGSGIGRPVSWRGPDEGDIKLPPPPPAEVAPSDLRDMTRAVEFSAQLLRGELGPGGLMERESEAARKAWSEAIDWLETAATEPMFPLFEWRQRKAKENAPIRRAGIATLTEASAPIGQESTR